MTNSKVYSNESQQDAGMAKAMVCNTKCVQMTELQANYQRLGMAIVLLLIGAYALLALKDGLYVTIIAAIFAIAGLGLLLASRQEIRFMFQDIRGMLS